MSISPSAATPCACWTGSEEQKPISTNVSRTEASFNLVPSLQQPPWWNSGFLQKPGPDQRGRGADRVSDQCRKSVQGQRSESSCAGTSAVGGDTLLQRFHLPAVEKNQCVIIGLMAEWMYVHVGGVFVLELPMPKVWTSAEVGCCWGLLVPSVDCWDLNVGSVSPKIPHYLHSEGTRHWFQKEKTTSEASLVFFSPHWPDWTSAPVAVQPQLREIHGHSRYWSDLCTSKKEAVFTLFTYSRANSSELIYSTTTPVFLSRGSWSLGVRVSIGRRCHVVTGVKEARRRALQSGRFLHRCSLFLLPSVLLNLAESTAQLRAARIYVAVSLKADNRLTSHLFTPSVGSCIIFPSFLH